MKSVMTTASGDGITDDTPFLQADLNALSKVAEPTRLWLPRGIYRVRSPLTFTAPSVATEIDADFGVMTPGVPASSAAGSLPALFRLTVSDGSGPFVLKRLTLNGSGLPQKKYVSAVGLEIRGGSSASVLVENVLAYLCQIGFAVVKGDGFVVRYCRATECQSVGWAIGGGQWTSPIHLDSCSATNGLLHGLWCAPGVRALLAEFHAESNSGWGVALGFQEAVFTGVETASLSTSGPPIQITGGLFEGNGIGGIVVFGPASAKIEWPRFVGGGEMVPIMARAGATVQVKLPFISSSPIPARWNSVPAAWSPQWTS